MPSSLLSDAAPSARSSSTSAAACTPGSTNRNTRAPTMKGSIWTSSNSTGSPGSTTIRCPGGNYFSGFRREDSVGPREKRPVRRGLAWHWFESNQVGLDGIAKWLKLTDSEPMPAVNVATRGILAALDLLEYANHPSGTALSALHIANGTPGPHNVLVAVLEHRALPVAERGHAGSGDDVDDFSRLCTTRCTTAISAASSPRRSTRPSQSCTPPPSPAPGRCPNAGSASTAGTPANPPAAPSTTPVPTASRCLSRTSPAPFKSWSHLAGLVASGCLDWLSTVVLAGWEK